MDNDLPEPPKTIAIAYSEFGIKKLDHDSPEYIVHKRCEKAFRTRMGGAMKKLFSHVYYQPGAEGFSLGLRTCAQCREGFR